MSTIEPAVGVFTAHVPPVEARSIVVSGDTLPSDNLNGLAEGADEPS